MAHANTTDVAQPVQEAVYIALKKRHERGRFFVYMKDERRRQSLQGGGGGRERRESGRSEAVASLGGEGSGVIRSMPSADLPDHGDKQIMITEVHVYVLTVQLEIWLGIKFGGLAVCLSTANFLFFACTYGNTVPCHQI